MDQQCVAEHSGGVRCKTVPLDEKEPRTPRRSSSFTKCLRNLPVGSPEIKTEVVNGYSLLYTWQGTRAELELVMVMAHQDVVSANPDEWTHPPFDGVITDGLIWGAAHLISRTS